MTDIADKIYAATGLTLGAEAAAKIGQMIQVENEKLRAKAGGAGRKEMSDEMDNNISHPGQPTHDRGKPITPPVTSEIVKLRAAVQDLAKHIWRGDWDKLQPETRALLGEKG